MDIKNNMAPINIEIVIYGIFIYVIFIYVILYNLDKMDNLKLSYPDMIESNNLIFININDINVMFGTDLENIEKYEYNAWDTKGNDYTSKLTQAICDVKKIPHNPKDNIILILQYFKDSLGVIAGFDTNTLSDIENDVNLSPYDGKSDLIWSVMKNKYNVNIDRYLKIYTYGTTFIFDAPKDCQHIFNASILKGSAKENIGLSYKSLLKLRGTSLKVQYEVRHAVMFTQFIEEIISKIEKENLKTIAIICRAGHHRSVACAEMLIHMYQNRIVEHLTI